MSTKNETYLNQVLKDIPNGAVVTSLWLKEKGVSNRLQSTYRQNDWLKSFGNGAFSKLNDKIEMDGAIYALQSQLDLSFHVGGISALPLKHGISHNIAFDRKIYIYGIRGEKLPKWFQDNYNEKIEVVKSEFLPADLGIEKFDNKDFETNISSIERSVLEMLYLAPDKNSLKEIYQLMEMLNVLKPKLIQELLENCSNIKVKRLFLYIAEKLDYPWFKKLDISKIDLGKGKRVIEKGGTLDKKYNIVIGNIEEI